MEIRQLDYNTISDVIVHVKYTAREGGSGLKTAANAALKDQLEAISQSLTESGLHTAFNMKHDLSNEWHLLKKNGTDEMTLDKSILPYMAQSIETTKIESVMFVGKIKDNPEEFTINIAGADKNLLKENELNLYIGKNSDIELGKLFSLSVSDADKPKLEELHLIVKYKF